MIPTRIDLDRKGGCGSPIRSRTGSKEIAAQDFWYAEDEMSVRNGLEDFLAKPLAKFHYPFLMT